MKPGRELFQLLLGFFVFGKNTLDHRPESRRVVHFPEIGQLMCSHVIDAMRRRLDEFPVEPYLTFGIAAAPACHCARQKMFQRFYSPFRSATARASCRERVSQYVSIYVVDRSLKQKQRKDN